MAVFVEKADSAQADTSAQGQASGADLLLHGQGAQGNIKTDILCFEFALPPEIFYRIIDRIDHPRFGVQYDPSNALVAGADHVEVLRRVLDRVVTMHASDRRMAEGHTLDFAAYLRMALMVDGVLDPRRVNPVNAAFP